LLIGSDATDAFTSGKTAPVAQTQTDANTYAWIAGWVVFIAVLAMLAQTDTGHNVIYYSLVLIILVLVLTQYRRIVDLLAPVGTEIPQ
jgi:cell division protein FtsW (lipid II flippase)